MFLNKGNLICQSYCQKLLWQVFSGKCKHALNGTCNSIFLCSVSSETSGFVDKLFESLYTKSYLPSAEPTKAEAKPAGQEKEEVKEEVMLFILPAFHFQISSPTFVRQNVTEKYTLLWVMISVSKEPWKVTIQTRTFYIPLQGLPLFKHSEILFTALAISVDNYLERFEREKQQKPSKTFPILYILWGMKII